MAQKINAGDVKRGDLFYLLPENIVVNFEENGRRTHHDENKILRLAQTILAEGQLQPVKVRRIEDNKVKLVAGYRRWAAIKMINDTLRPDSQNPMRLTCVSTDINAEQAFIHNIIENKEREDTTPIDDAINHQRLREQYGWNNTDIAKLYNCSPSIVSNYSRLLRLPSEIQEAIEKGILTIKTGMDLTDLPEDQQIETFKKAYDAGVEQLVKDGIGQVIGADADNAQEVQHKRKLARAIAAKVREGMRGGQNGQQNGKTPALTLKEVRTYYQQVSTNDTADTRVRAIADANLALMKGEITHRQWVNHVQKAMENEVVPA